MSLLSAAFMISVEQQEGYSQGGTEDVVCRSGIFGSHGFAAGEPLPVWGSAKPLSQVCVSLDTETVTGMSDEEGLWMVRLSPKDTARGAEMTSAPTHLL